MGLMVLDPNNDRGHQIHGTSEKGQEYQAVRIFGKDSYGVVVRIAAGTDGIRNLSSARHR